MKGFNKRLHFKLKSGLISLRHEFSLASNGESRNITYTSEFPFQNSQSIINIGVRLRTQIKDFNDSLKLGIKFIYIWNSND
jgi:hypothetical protein